MKLLAILVFLVGAPVLAGDTHSHQNGNGHSSHGNGNGYGHHKRHGGGWHPGNGGGSHGGGGGAPEPASMALLFAGASYLAGRTALKKRGQKKDNA